MTGRLFQHIKECCALTQLDKVHFTSNSEELKDTYQVCDKRQTREVKLIQFKLKDLKDFL